MPCTGQASVGGKDTELQRSAEVRAFGNLSVMVGRVVWDGDVQLADVACTLSCTLRRRTFPPSMPSTSTSCLSPFLRLSDVTPLSLNSVAMALTVLLKARLGVGFRKKDVRSV